MFNVSRPSGFKPFLGVTQEQARAKGPSPLVVKDCWDCDDDASVISTEGGVIEILSTIGGWGVYASEVIPVLRAMDGEGKTILVRINSYGGDVFEGLAIANTIADLKAKTIVEIIGVAASIASVIAVAADVVRIRKSAQMMIHRPWAWLWGEADELRKAAAHLDMIEGQLVETYVDRSNGKKSTEEFAAAVAAETWMTGAQAVEWGLADEVLSKAAAAVEPLDDETKDAAGIKNAPMALFASADAEQAPAPDAQPEADSETAPNADANQDAASADDPPPPPPPAAAPTPDAAGETDAVEKNAEQDATPPQAPVNNGAYDDHAVAAIRSAFARAKRPELADEAMATGLTVDQAKAKAFDLIAAQDAATQPSTAIVGSEGTAAPKAKTPDEVMAEIRAQQLAAFAPKKR
ncbi:head maturation protease, ClpP-related [Ruixingdingia sedimenti]|uniref:ATP-dependent Clp protease proteolytic subunit n=1 Tax=Ruixingdingia sedimenti TaxID=3073604 RepID=A0ABU1FD99_9RHOB|nr:head maturation protease, ClpP-related [Xinfangfangia sp. LG-4]MDR5654873.1 Clp protease ClpP [Xinfangfangia sp. LG-4]